jgi:hypothetical protein
VLLANPARKGGGCANIASLKTVNKHGSRDATMADMRCKQCGQYYDDWNRPDCPHCEREALMEMAKRARAVGASTDADATTPAGRASAHRTTPEIPEWRLLVTARGADGTMPMTGMFLQVVSSILIVIIVIGGLVWYSRFGGGKQDTFEYAYWVVLALCALPLWLSTVGTRMRRKGAVEILNEDSRPPILLLRSFAADGLTVEGRQSNTTIELILESALSNFGPVIAIGRPSQKIPPLGAARFWVDDEHWQLVIAKLLPACQLVVMIMGTVSDRSGLAWEVEQLFLTQTQVPLWIVVPPRSEDWIDRRWREYELLVGNRFPGNVAGAVLITFTPNPSGHVHCVKKRWFRGYVRNESAYSNAIVAAISACRGAWSKANDLIVPNNEPLK